MLHRSRPSGAQNRKRKMQEQKSNEAQLGSLKPFVGIQKKNNGNVEENIEHNKNPINNENSKSEHAIVNESEHDNVNESEDVDVNNDSEDHVQKLNESVDKVNYDIFYVSLGWFTF